VGKKISYHNKFTIILMEWKKHLKPWTQVLFVLVQAMKKNNRRPFSLLVAFFQLPNQQRYPSIRFPLRKCFLLASQINEFISQEKNQSEKQNIDSNSTSN